MCIYFFFFFFFFFNDTATTEIYTLSLHDALPINRDHPVWRAVPAHMSAAATVGRSEEHTSELQSHHDLVCRLLLEKKKKQLTVFYRGQTRQKRKQNTKQICNI